MKKIITFFTLLFIFLFIVGFFMYSNEISNAINFSFKLWKENLFPSLFPFFIISTLLINIGFVDLISDLFQNVFNKLFKVKKEASFVFFLSMLSGYPSNAKYIKDLLDKKQISTYDAIKILNFTCFPNPLFIINTIGIMFFNSIKIGLIILSSYYLSNIITAIIFRSYHPCNDAIKPIKLKNSINNFNQKISNANIFNVLLNAIVESIKTLIIIFATISFFLILLTIISQICNLTEPFNSILSGIIEMTTGLKYISILEMPIKIKVIISCSFIAFGGFSIHGQILSILKDYQISYISFLLYRIVLTIISSLLTFVMLMV